jgi:hypothetical protein
LCRKKPEHFDEAEQSGNAYPYTLAAMMHFRFVWVRFVAFCVAISNFERTPAVLRCSIDWPVSISMAKLQVLPIASEILSNVYSVLVGFTAHCIAL